MDHAIGNAALLCGVGQRHTFALVDDESVAALVSVLGFSRRPAAVIGPVAFFIVNAVKRGSWRARSHISEEIFEPLPSPTYLDASTPIGVKTTIIGVVASLQHRLPEVVFRQMLCASSRAVSGFHLRGNFCSATSAAERAPFSERPSHDISFCAAFAPAAPKIVAFASGRFLDDSPAAESLACKIQDALASTTLRSAMPQSIAARDAFVSADASTAPQRSAGSRAWDSFDYSEMPECLPRNVYGTWRSCHVRL